MCVEPDVTTAFELVGKLRLLASHCRSGLREPGCRIDHTRTRLRLGGRDRLTRKKAKRDGNDEGPTPSPSRECRLEGFDDRHALRKRKRQTDSKADGPEHALTTRTRSDPFAVTHTESIPCAFARSFFSWRQPSAAPAAPRRRHPRRCPPAMMKL